MNKEIVALGKALLTGTLDTNFASKEASEIKLREKFATLCTDENGKFNKHEYGRNKETIFELMEEIVEDILPMRIEKALGKLVTQRNFDDNDKPRFKLKKGRKNVGRFVTKVSAAGIYDRVKISGDYIDVDMEALGGAVYVPFNDYISGDVTISEVLQLMLDELEDAIYVEVQNAIKATLTSLPANNKHTSSTLVEDEMKKIINTVKAYGEPTIICTQEFANILIPSANFISERDKELLNQQGYLGKYAGANVITMSNSFTDETNTTKVLDPQYAYVVPAGSEDSLVQLAFEGQTHMKDSDREDWSKEIQLFKKFGIAILHTNFFGIYQNTSL